MIFGRSCATWEEEIKGLKPQQIQMYALAWKYAEAGHFPGCCELIEKWGVEISPYIRVCDLCVVIERLYWHGYFHRNGYIGLDINDYIPGKEKKIKYKPKRDTDINDAGFVYKVCYCGNCGALLKGGDFCCMCGKEVDWNE